MGISDPWVAGVAFDPRTAGVAWTVTDDGAVYRTEDLGDSWRQVLGPASPLVSRPFAGRPSH